MRVKTRIIAHTQRGKFEYEERVRNRVAFRHEDRISIEPNAEVKKSHVNWRSSISVDCDRITAEQLERFAEQRQS